MWQTEIGIRLTIHTDPRVPTREIATTYDEVRAAGGSTYVQAERSRTLSTRRATLATFLMEHRLESWSVMSGKWNAEHPEWASKSFRREALDAWRRVVGRDFVKPKKPSDQVVLEPAIEVGKTLRMHERFMKQKQREREE
jgi:hypothetical protein